MRFGLRGRAWGEGGMGRELARRGAWHTRCAEGLRAQGSGSGVRTQGSGLRTQDLGLRTWDSALGTQPGSAGASLAVGVRTAGAWRPVGGAAWRSVGGAAWRSVGGAAWRSMGVPGLVREHAGTVALRSARWGRLPGRTVRGASPARVLARSGARSIGCSLDSKNAGSLMAPGVLPVVRGSGCSGRYGARVRAHRRRG